MFEKLIRGNGRNNGLTQSQRERLVEIKGRFDPNKDGTSDTPIKTLFPQLPPPSIRNVQRANSLKGKATDKGLANRNGTIMFDVVTVPKHLLKEEDENSLSGRVRALYRKITDPIVTNRVHPDENAEGVHYKLSTSQQSTDVLSISYDWSVNRVSAKIEEYTEGGNLIRTLYADMKNPIIGGTTCKIKDILWQNGSRKRTRIHRIGNFLPPTIYDDTKDVLNTLSSRIEQDLPRLVSEAPKEKGA